LIIANEFQIIIFDQSYIDSFCKFLNFEFQQIWF